jgi:type VI protein secretion system component VasK
MKFWKKVVSDEEYVEQIRKRDRIFRWMQWIWPVLLIALVCCLFSIAGLIQKFAADIPTDRAVFYGGLVLGALFGFMFIMTAAQAGLALKQWIEARTGFRTERLLLQYHDRLMEKEASNKSVQATGEDARA